MRQNDIASIDQKIRYCTWENSIFPLSSSDLFSRLRSMKRAQQLGFEILEDHNVKHFGGMYLKNSNPKKKRPLSIKRSSHLVMRSLHAKGSRSFLRFDTKIQDILSRQGRRFGVKVYRFANGGNHLHLVVLPSSRRGFNSFIRTISGLIARLVLGAEKGSAKGLKFWEKRPFTRIVEWGRDYKNVCAYLLQNTLEALGFIDYQPRKTRYGSGRSDIKRSGQA